MGLILDLAVVAIAVVVVGALALLAWTLAVSAVRAVHIERMQVASVRRSIADGEDRLRADAARMSASLARMAEHTKPIRPEASSTDGPGQPGEQPDA